MVGRILRSSIPWKIGLIASGALLIGVTAYWLTSSHAQYSILGPACLIGLVREPGFDPWTGEPFGAIYRCANGLPGLGDGGTHDVTDDPPEDIADRRAVSIPLGAAIGAALLGSLGIYAERRRRRPYLTVADEAVR